MRKNEVNPQSLIAFRIDLLAHPLLTSFAITSH
jgi:hypothetical protein